MKNFLRPHRLRTTVLVPIFLLLLLLPPAVRGAPFSDLLLGGHFKSLNIHLQPSPLDEESSGVLSSNRLRIDLTGTVVNTVDFELSAENILRYSNPPNRIPLPRDSVNRILDLEENISESGHFDGQFFVDRLNLKTDILGFEWTLGRQTIGFGRISLFSPLDIIAPFPPDALDTDVRPGVDAFRTVRYFGTGGQIGGVAIFGDCSENNSYLATFSHNLKGVDLLGLAGWLRDRPTAGFGIAVDIGGLGLKGEVVGHKGKDLSDPDGDLYRYFVTGAVEAWYRFKNDLVVLAEYLYNGSGKGNPEEYYEVLNSAPNQEGLNFLLGRHYLLAGPSYEAHPLVRIEGLLIWNLEDDSFFFRPLVDFSLSDNLDLQIFWAFTEGKKPNKDGLLPGTVLRSEFGSAEDYGGLFLKYHF